MEDALEAERLRERVAGLERLVGELEGEREAWKAQAEWHEEAARELRILVQQAQALTAGDEAPLHADARNGNPNQRTTSEEHTGDVADETGAPWWRRWWRSVTGGA